MGECIIWDLEGLPDWAESQRLLCESPPNKPLTSCPALKASASAVYVTFVLCGHCLLDTDSRQTEGHESQEMKKNGKYIWIFRAQAPKAFI